MTEPDKFRAVKAFHMRETRRRENRQLMLFMSILGAAELLIMLIFFVH